MNKKNILICGQPNNVLRIFIKSLCEHYNIFFISYSKKYQYLEIEKLIGKNAFVVDGNSPKDMMKLISISYKILLRYKINFFLAFHNHFIKNGIMLTFIYT